MSCLACWCHACHGVLTEGAALSAVQVFSVPPKDMAEARAKKMVTMDWPVSLSRGHYDK